MVFFRHVGPCRQPYYYRHLVSHPDDRCRPTNNGDHANTPHLYISSSSYVSGDPQSRRISRRFRGINKHAGRIIGQIGRISGQTLSIRKLEISIDHLSRAINEMPMITANLISTALRNAMQETTDISRIRALDDEEFDSRLFNLDVAPVNRYFGTP